MHRQHKSPWLSLTNVTAYLHKLTLKLQAIKSIEFWLLKASSCIIRWDLNSPYLDVFHIMHSAKRKVYANRNLLFGKNIIHAGYIPENQKHQLTILK